jgi:ribosomal protein S18 acetylase RimI-like enzyme
MVNSGIEIRRANPGDIDAIVAFQQAMARETEGKTLDGDTLRKGVNAVFLSPDRGFYLVAEAPSIDSGRGLSLPKGSVVGSLLITYEWSDWRNASFWWIQSVYVDMQWRRKGVYRAMHDYLYGIASGRDDICGIRLYVERSNSIAQQTYSSLGMSRSHYDLYEIDFVL